MFYQIIFWLSLGFIIGSISLTIFWLAALTDMAKKGNLYLRRDKDSKWIPVNPILGINKGYSGKTGIQG